MNTIEFKVHFFQREILKKLITAEKGHKFSELMINGLESEHMNYHLKQLLTLGLISKSGQIYKLTDKGKDYTNLMDDNNQLIEKQPKTSVILKAVRKREGSDEYEHLVCKRLKQPYYGKVGRLTGKVRFGEMLQEAALRELYEETGLVADTFWLEKVYHKMRFRKETKEVIQDVNFYIFYLTDFHGDFISENDIQENFWITESEAKSRDDLYDDFKLDNPIGQSHLTFEESKKEAQGY